MSTDVETTADLEYAQLDGASLRLDLHRPQRREPCPCVVYFHGGGWAVGTRADLADERLRPLAGLGVAVASVSYRLTDTATHPAQIEDGRAAIRWLRDHGRELGIRTERMGAWGASAGAWIALMLGRAGGAAAESVQAVAAWMPVTNLLTVAGERAAAGLPLPAFLDGRPVPAMEAALLGLELLEDDPAAARAASPLTHAEELTCPTLIVHGDRDGLVNHAQSVAMHEALLAAGRPSQLLLLAGANHEDPLYESPAVLAATAGFLRAALS